LRTEMEKVSENGPIMTGKNKGTVEATSSAPVELPVALALLIVAEKDVSIRGLTDSEAPQTKGAPDPGQWISHTKPIPWAWVEFAGSRKQKESFVDAAVRQDCQLSDERRSFLP
jgi:hypothetical protein